MDRVTSKSEGIVHAERSGVIEATALFASLGSFGGVVSHDVHDFDGDVCCIGSECFGGP